MTCYLISLVQISVQYLPNDLPEAQQIDSEVDINLLQAVNQWLTAPPNLLDPKVVIKSLCTFGENLLEITEVTQQKLIRIGFFTYFGNIIDSFSKSKYVFLEAQLLFWFSSLSKDVSICLLQTQASHFLTQAMFSIHSPTQCLALEAIYNFVTDGDECCQMLIQEDIIPNLSLLIRAKKNEQICLHILYALVDSDFSIRDLETLQGLIPIFFELENSRQAKYASHIIRFVAQYGLTDSTFQSVSFISSIYQYIRKWLGVIGNPEVSKHAKFIIEHYLDFILYRLNFLEEAQAYLQSNIFAFLDSLQNDFGGRTFLILTKLIRRFPETSQTILQSPFMQLAAQAIQEGDFRPKMASANLVCAIIESLHNFDLVHSQSMIKVLELMVPLIEMPMPSTVSAILKLYISIVNREIETNTLVIAKNLLQPENMELIEMISDSDENSSELAEHLLNILKTINSG